MSLPLLIVPEILDWIFLILGVVSFLILSAILYKIILAPALEAKAELDSPPPHPGFQYQLLIEDTERHQIVSIGQLDATINTRMVGIHEDQLRLEFHKDRGLEEYEIDVIPGSNLYYRRPHAKKIELLKERDQFAARELIGHPALFRLAAQVKDNRPLQYIEFTLSTKYIINNLGEEKMQFTIELTRIYPGLDENSRDKHGLFHFGRLQKKQDEQEDI